MKQIIIGLIIIGVLVFAHFVDDGHVVRMRNKLGKKYDCEIAVLYKNNGTRIYYCTREGNRVWEE